MERHSKRASSSLTMHRSSHEISKSKPKIRIVHLFEPGIIQTDVTHFRSLVQRLTGRPDEQKPVKETKTTNSQDSGGSSTQVTESKDGSQSSICLERIKDEREEAMWRGESSICFFNGLGDLDGFIESHGDQFPLLPMTISSGMDLLEEYLLYRPADWILYILSLFVFRLIL